MNSKLPTKSEEKMKLFFAFVIDKPRNPLFQGISRNFKPQRKSTRQGNFPHPREKKARQARLRIVQDHALWREDERKTRAEHSSQVKHSMASESNHTAGKSISLHEGKTITRGNQLLKMGTKDLSLDASQALLRSGALWLSERTAILSKHQNPSSFFFIVSYWQMGN